MKLIIQYEEILGKYYGYVIDGTMCRIDDNSFYADTLSKVYQDIREYYEEDSVKIVKGWNVA